MKKPDARTRILEAARELFFERGYSEVGVNEIISRADTAKASFYQHFPSKESLCEAWLDSIHYRSTARMEALLAASGAPEEKIESYFVQLGQILEANQYRGCPFTNTSAVIDPGCEGIRQHIIRHKDSVRNFLLTLSRQLCANETAATGLANALFLLYSGATTEAQNARALWPVEAARCAVRLLCAAADTPCCGFVKIETGEPLAATLS